MQPAFGMAECSTCMAYNNDYGASADVAVLKASLQEGTLRLAAAHDASAQGAAEPTASFVDLGPPCPGVEIRICAQARDGATARVLRELQVGG